MVLAIAWERKGELAIFLLNFDPKRDAEVRIKAERLPAKAKIFVDGMSGRSISPNEPVRIPKLGIVAIRIFALN